MKRLLQERTKTNSSIFVAMVTNIYTWVMDLIIWIFQMIGYFMLWIALSIGKINAKIFKTQDMWNLSIDEYKDMTNEFLEKRKIHKEKHHK